MDLKETESEGVNWIYVALNRDSCRAVVNTVLNVTVPQNEGKFLLE
jgi:hypothetical protein